MNCTIVLIYPYYCKHHEVCYKYSMNVLSINYFFQLMIFRGKAGNAKTIN